MTKGKLHLNPDAYSASSYLMEETEEDKRTISIEVVVKSLIVLMILGILVLVYNYAIENNFTTEISRWLTKKEVSHIPEIKESILIQEESIEEEVEKVKKIASIVKIEEDAPRVDTVESNKNNELSDEYIKLMQDSLGKY